MSDDSPIAVLARRERHRDWYQRTRDPILEDRLLWQAQAFRHLVHLLPGESILELGAGDGRFTAWLGQVSRGRNPVTAVAFGDSPAAPVAGVERIVARELPGPLGKRRFDYVVAQNVLDRRNASFVFTEVYRLLRPGGRAILFESNPWNPVFVARAIIGKLFGRPLAQRLHSRPELYELVSEVGFVRLSVQFTDFVYRPVPGALMRLFRNLSVVLENAPGVRLLAGRIVIHGQVPPRRPRRRTGSLARHEPLLGRVSVVVPCHNEEANLGPLVKEVTALFDPYIRQIVLVDDNSRDGTRAEIERLARDDRRILGIFRGPPHGVGHALRDGYAAVDGEWVLSVDCDFQHLLPEFEDLFDAAAEGWDAVLGSRFSRHSLLINYPFGKILANRAFHVLSNLLFRRWHRDLTNNLRLMRTDLVRRLRLQEPAFAVNAEVGLQLVLLGARVKEVPISWINRTFDMGQSTFRLGRVGGGYIRVLWRLVRLTRFGRRPLGGR